MSVRNSTAIIVGIIIGCISGYSVANAGYGAGIALAFWTILSAVVVYRIAERKAIWISVVPNITLVLVAGVVERLNYPYRSFQLLAVLLGAVLIAIFSLVITAPIYWIRRYLSERASKKESANDR